MLTLFQMLQNSLLQFFAIFGIFLLGGGGLTLLARWTNNAFNQFLFPRFGLYAFGVIGIPVHEFSHAFFCRLFAHEIKKVKWFDAKAKNGAHGSVTHLYSPWNIYHRVGHFFIGLGPVILGPIAIALLFYFLVPEGRHLLHLPLTSMTMVAAMAKGLLKILIFPSVLTSPKFYLFLYLSICITSQIELSREDIKQALVGIVPILLILFTCNVLAWALNASWHPYATAWGRKGFTFAASILLLSSLFSGINMALCALTMAFVNRVLGRNAINPFRAISTTQDG